MLPLKFSRQISIIILVLLFILPMLPNLNLNTIPAAFNYLQQLIPVLLLLFIGLTFVITKVKSSTQEIKIKRGLIWPMIFISNLLLQYAIHGSLYFSTYLTDISIIMVITLGIIALTNLLSTKQIITIIAYAIIISCYIQVILSIFQLLNITYGSILKIYDNNEPYYLLIKWLHIPGYQRITGGIGQPNELADFLTWGILSTLFILQERVSNTYNIIRWTTVTIFALFIAITQSRAAYFYPMIIIIYALLLNKFHSKNNRVVVRQLIVSGIIMGIMMMLFKLGIMDLFTAASKLDATHQIATKIDTSLAADRVISITQRYVMWSKGLAMFFSHPVLGVGWDQYPLHYITMPLPSYVHYVHGEMATVNNCHNLLIQFLATTGIIGTAVLLGWIGYTVFSLWKLPIQRQFLPLGIFLIVLTHSQFEFPLFKTYLLTAIAIITISQDTAYLKVNLTTIKFKALVLIICTIGFWQSAIGIRNYLLLAKIIPPQEYQIKRPANNIFNRYVMVSSNPWWDDYADLDLATDMMYDVKTSQNSQKFDALHQVLRRISTHFPHPALVLKLAILDKVTGNDIEANYWIKQMTTNYIGFEPTFSSYITQLTPDIPTIRQQLLTQLTVTPQIKTTKSAPE